MNSIVIFPSPKNNTPRNSPWGMFSPPVDDRVSEIIHFWERSILKLFEKWEYTKVWESLRTTTPTKESFDKITWVFFEHFTKILEQQKFWDIQVLYSFFSQHDFWDFQSTFRKKMREFCENFLFIETDWHFVKNFLLFLWEFDGIPHLSMVHIVQQNIVQSFEKKFQETHLNIDEISQFLIEFFQFLRVMNTLPASYGVGYALENIFLENNALFFSQLYNGSKKINTFHQLKQVLDICFQTTSKKIFAHVLLHFLVLCDEDRDDFPQIWKLVIFCLSEISYEWSEIYQYIQYIPENADEIWYIQRILKKESWK